MSWKDGIQIAIGAAHEEGASWEQVEQVIDDSMSLWEWNEPPEQPCLPS